MFLRLCNTYLYSFESTLPLPGHNVRGQVKTRPVYRLARAVRILLAVGAHVYAF